MNEEQQQYVRDLIQGKTKPPNRYVQTLVDQLRATEQMLADAVPKVQQGAVQLEQQKQRVTGLTAIAQQTTATLLAWRAEPPPATAEDSEG